MSATFTACSHFSHYGSSSVGDIVNKFKELGYTHATLTEYGNVNSSIEFYEKCKKAELKPILGVQIYIRDQWNRVQYKKVGKQLKPVDQFGSITIHFLNEDSYLNFCKLTPNFHDKMIKDLGDEKPVLDIDEVASLKGITVGTSGLEGLIGKSFDSGNLTVAKKIFIDLKEKFNCVFVEVSPLPGKMRWVKPFFSRGGREILREGQFVENDPEDHVPDGDYQKSFNDFMIGLAKDYGGVVVPSLDFHFSKESQKLVQDAKLSKNGKALVRFCNSHHMRSEEEVKSLFFKMGYDANDVNGWFCNIGKWVSLFKDFKITTAKDRWILMPFDGDYKAELKKRIDRHGRMDWNDQAMVDRLKKEISVLANNGQINLLPYLFTVEDGANWCREKGLLMNVRGSAGGSLILYLLGVSAFNPLKHDLKFERFLTEGRIKAGTLPDVDIDLSDQSRFVDEYLNVKYGESVCRISTNIALKLKSAIKDAERSAFGKVRPETEKMCSRSLPDSAQGDDEYEFVFGSDDNGTHTPGVLDTNKELKKYAKGNPEVWSTVTEMLGVMRQKSTHACGFVIADGPVQDYIPITYIKGTKVTGLDPKQVESAGLIKYDFLGVNTLKDIEYCIKSIKDRLGKEYNPFELPHSEECFKNFAEGKTETVFQFNTATVIPFLMAIKPKTIDDLSAITALCRPGTLDAPSGDGRTLAQVFVARAQGEDIRYIHPDLEPILKETKGIQLYQEQTLQVFRDIAGYSFEEAETVRRGIGKKIESVLKSCMGDLRDACINRGWTDEQVDLLIDQIMASSRYSFNKSHAMAYAYNAYACMWLKTHYPLDWWKATLTNADKKEVATVFWNYVKNFADLPAVNKSGMEYKIEGDRLITPLSIISGLGEKSFKSLVKHSPYDSLYHFVNTHFKKSSTDSRSPIHTGIATKLVAAGVLDPLFEKPSLSIEDKIREFNTAKAAVRNSRSVEPVPEEYQNMSKFKNYLIKKRLMKIYSEDLRPVVLPSFNGKNERGMWTMQSSVLRHTGNLHYLSGQQYYILRDKILEKQEFLPEQKFFGLVCFVMDEKVFDFHNKKKQATKVWIDVDGYVTEEVVWPGWEESVAETGFKDNICLVIMKAKEGKDGKNRINIYDIQPILTKR